MKRHLLYLLTWWGGRKWRRYLRGRHLEKLIVRKMAGNVDVADTAIAEMLASPKKPVLYKHAHRTDHEVFCLHLPILILKK